MARKPKITLDSAGMAAMLKSLDVADAVAEIAADVASKVSDDPAIVRHELGNYVTVEDFVTDRAVSVVAIAHPAGRGIEGKYGVLTKAVGGDAPPTTLTYTTKSGKTRTATQAQIDNWSRGRKK